MHCTEIITKKEKLFSDQVESLRYGVLVADLIMGSYMYVFIGVQHAVTC